MESEKEINYEEVKSVIEAMAASGKFWHDWDKLKGMLSFHLKQVLSDYPEAKMTIEQQKSCLGESLPELAERLDDVGRKCDVKNKKVEWRKKEELE
ncbi:hypothetical protein HAX54_033164 [Datura stramonium]|uniref:Uncharacterized protein n=1 Tax=Datura stramonium TaxID=4076 RepID=A0ABS8VE53_DATST|nr:hypothetical protein [Datura stramonium]